MRMLFFSLHPWMQNVITEPVPKLIDSATEFFNCTLTWGILHDEYELWIMVDKLSA